MSETKHSKIIDLRQEFKQQIDDLMPGESTFLIDADMDIDEWGNLVYSIYAGSQLSIYPSGKIYAFWTTNQTWRDVIMDSYFEEMLTERLEQFGWYHMVESGDVWICENHGEEFYTTEDGKTFYQYGSKVANHERELVQHQFDAGVFPATVSISDHGNVSLYQFDVPFETHYNAILGA